VTEPTIPASVGIVTVAVALLGPLAGPYAVIVLSALAGALWALSAAPTANRADGAWLVLRLVLSATMLTGGVAWWLERTYDWPVHQVLAPVAFGIGMGGNRWRALSDRILAALDRRVGGGAP
jgi:hypothetical protein